MHQTPSGGIMDVADPSERNAGWQGGNSVSVEENMALARRFFDARVKTDLDALDKMLAPDFVSYTAAPGQQLDRESYMRHAAESVSAFSDVRFVIEDQVAAGDKVVSRISGRGTHARSELLGTTPTGTEIASIAIFIHRISEGKISEEWGAGTGRSELLGQRLEQEIRERERVEQELRVARSIQQASLPEEVPTLAGWQITPYYRPAREVGGDFYDFHLLSDGRLGVVVGDATGKGVPAALVMSTTLGMLRLAAQSYSSPGQMLQRVNEALFPYIPANMFVTCFYAILDPESGLLRYANAGHDLPYLHHDGKAKELRARGMPLGLMPGMSYEGKENSLEEALLEELYSFVGEGWEQEDDITLVTLRRAAARH